MRARRRRLVGARVERAAARARRRRHEARRAPTHRVRARVEVLLERAEVRALELPGPVRAVEQDAPAVVGQDLAHPPARLFHSQRHQEAGLAERPGAFAVAIEEDLDADHVRAWHQPAREVERVGLVRARVAGRRTPLHAPAVDEQPVAAVGAHEAPRRDGRRGELELASEEHEGVGERALAGQPDPARGSEVDARARRGLRPAAPHDGDGRGLGRGHGGRARGRLCGRARPSASSRASPSAARGLAGLRRRDAGRCDRGRDRRAEAAQEPRRPAPAPPRTRFAITFSALPPPGAVAAVAQRARSLNQDGSLSREARRAPREWRAPAGFGRRASASRPRRFPTPAARACAAAAPGPARAAPARRAGHPRVGQQHVDRLGALAREPQRLLGVRGGQHPVAELFQQLARDLARRLRALGHQHGLAALRSRSVVRERDARRAGVRQGR